MKSARPARSMVVLRARLVAGLAVVCLFGLPWRTAAADGIWGSLRLPGGVAAARRVVDLGDGPRQKTTFLLDFTRMCFTLSVNRQPPVIDTFVRYLAFLNDTERSLAAWPDGLVIVAGAAKDRQEAFRDFVERLGVRVRTDRGRTTVELGRDVGDIERHGWLSAIGVQIRDVVGRLNVGESVRILIPTDEVPLPLPAMWSGVVFEKTKDPLAELVSNQRALFTYLGLMELDRPTLEWVGEHPEVFRRIYQDRATVFGAFGGALRIQAGAIAVPGGTPAVPLWEGLAGASVSAPAEFLANLLERNNGRLAYFYATTAAADAAHQRFLLGLTGDAKDARTHLRYVQDVRDRFADAIPTWDVGLQPLFRPAIDPALTILTLDLDGSGAAGPDWWPSVFERIASGDSWPERPADTLKSLKVRQADAAWLLSYVFDQPAQIADRWTWVRFAQRRFPSADTAVAPDVEIALRALKDMPTLVPALERMGVTDPAVYADVSRAAHRLASVGEGVEVDAALSAWQGALATLEQVARHRPISSDVLTPLLKSLAATVSTKPLTATGNVAGWFLHNLLPALKATADADGRMEPAVLTKLLNDARKSPVFEWEGLPYRIDTTGPAAISAAALRAVMPGPRLQHLATLDEAARKLSKPLPTIEALSDVIRQLESVSKSWPNQDLVDAVKDLRKISKPKDLQKAPKQAPRIVLAIEAATSAIMPGFVYALAMSPTDQPARVFADGPGMHELSSRENTGRLESFAWKLGEASIREKGGAAIRGSLLGLDVARAAEHLTVVMGAPGAIGQHGGAIRDAARARLAERVVLRATIDWTTEGRAVAAAIARGRSQVAAWKGTKTAVDDELTKAGMSQGRQNQLIWLMDRRDWDAVDRFVTVVDLYHLGTPADLSRGWGVAGRGIDGCWCIQGVDRRPVERFRGYAVGHADAAAAEVFLRLAEILTQMQLPLTLIEPMLPFAIQDALDQSDQFLPDDWEPLTWAGLLPEARVDQYLQALLAWHILAAPDKSAAPGGSF